MNPIRLDETNLGAYLAQLGLVPHGALLRVERAGDGNINWVRRASIDGGPSWVVKQARSALEAFPEYSASTERIGFEARFYQQTAVYDRDAVCPRVERFDPDNHVLVLEDLCGLERMDAAIARGADVGGCAGALLGFLGRVHAADPGADWKPDDNAVMRKLHGDHIFHLTFRADEFPLSPAVARRARTLRENATLIAKIADAHTRYLEPGGSGALVHADVQPTNILLGDRGPKLLDAEIAHIGDPAFDIGVLIAHLVLASLAGAQRPDIARSWSAYQNARGREGPQLADVLRYAGIEMLRRTLGAARSPGVERDDCALAIIESGCAFVESPLDALARF